MQFSKQIVLWIGGEFFEVGLEKIRKTNKKKKKHFLALCMGNS